MIQQKPFTLLTVPKVYIDVNDFQKMIAFVLEVQHTECQWYMCIKRHISGALYYTLENFYIPPQIVSGTTVESPSSAWLTVLEDVQAQCTNNDIIDTDRVNAIIQSMHGWCHSHVNMGVHPSPVDEKNFADWIKGNLDQNIHTPVMMLILNKKHECYIRITDPELGLTFENPPFVILYESLDSSLLDKLKQRIQVRQTPVALLPVNHKTSQDKAKQPKIKFFADKAASIFDKVPFNTNALALELSIGQHTSSPQLLALMDYLQNALSGEQYQALIDVALTSAQGAIARTLSPEDSLVDILKAMYLDSTDTTLRVMVGVALFLTSSQRNDTVKASALAVVQEANAVCDTWNYANYVMVGE